MCVICLRMYVKTLDKHTLGYFGHIRQRAAAAAAEAATRTKIDAADLILTTQTGAQAQKGDCDFFRVFFSSRCLCWVPKKSVTFYMWTLAPQKRGDLSSIIFSIFCLRVCVSVY